jgi:hypothetical protein
MNRNFVTGTIITSVLTLLFLIVFYFSKINTKSIHAINVLPQNTVLALEVNNINLQFKLLNQQLFWQQLTNNKLIGEANNQLKYLDSLLNFEKNFKDWKNGENMVLSFHAYTNQTIDPMVLFETKKKFDLVDISNWIYQVNKNRLMVSKRKFSSNLIYDFIDFKTQQKFSIAFKNKIFAISTNGALIEETLLNIEKDKAYEMSRLDKLSFVKSLGSYSLYVNYKNIPTFLSSFFDVTQLTSLNNIPKMASWSAFGVNTSASSIQLKGVSITDDVLFEYFDCFNNMQPQEQSFKKLLPHNTSYYFGINYNNEVLFKQNLNEFYSVNKIDTNNPSRDSINQVKKNLNLYNQLLQTFGNEISEASFANPQLSFDSCKVLIIKLKDKNALLSQLKHICTIDSNLMDTFVLKTPNLFQINLLNYFDYTWGNVFLNTQANYALVYADYLLLCNNSITLNEYYNNLTTSNLLSKNIDYITHTSEITNQANIELFLNNNFLPQQLETYLNPTLLDAYKTNMSYVKKARFASFQVSATKDKNYLTNLQISFNTNANNKTELLWELNLDTTISTKPEIVFNSATNQNCIMVQDLKNQVYLIDNESKILFKVPVSGKIIGKINQVDAYQNGKTQFLFNTNNQIYLIDETGKNLYGYPLWIPTGTEYPIQVFDYLNNKNYQLFAIGKYYKIWCYNIQTRLLPGWNPLNYYPNPIKNIQAFSLRNDLISYTINQKGKLNFYSINGKPASNFGFDSNMTYSYITHNQIDTNSVYFYYVDSTNQMKMKEYHTETPAKNKVLQAIRSTPKHQFMVNKSIYWGVQLGKNYTIYNASGNAIYSKICADTFDYQFNLMYKSGSIQVSYLDSLKGKLYLEKLNNLPENNFPLNANYYYTFGHLMNDENYFVITSGIDNKLLVYQVK